MSEQSIYNKNLETVLDRLVKEAHSLQYPLEVASKTVVQFNNVEFQDIRDPEDHALSKFLLKICSLACLPLEPSNTEWQISPLTTAIGATLVRKYKLTFKYPVAVKQVSYSKLNIIKSVSPYFIEDIMVTTENSRFCIEVVYRSSKCFPNVSPQMITLITAPEQPHTHVNYAEKSIDDHIGDVLDDIPIEDGKKSNGGGGGWFGFLNGNKKRKLSDMN